jgi:hypothetical protein
MHQCSLRVIDCKLSSYCSETKFYLQGQDDLELWLKAIGVIDLQRPMHLWRLKVKGPWLVKLLIENRIDLRCDLDLCPLDHKINRGHTLVMDNQHTKFKVHRLMLSLVIARNPFGLRTDRPIDRQMQSNIPPLVWRGITNKLLVFIYFQSFKDNVWIKYL